MVRITLDLPDVMMTAIQAAARADGLTVDDFVISTLRSELDHRRRTSVAHFHFPTVGGLGLADDVRAENAVESSYGTR